jgi:hypothetical protein
MKKEGTRFTREADPNYLEERLNGNQTKCKHFKKI